MEHDFSVSVGGVRLTNLTRIIDVVLDQYEERIGRDLNELDVNARRDAVRFLYGIGFFDMRNSVETFCSRANVTKVTVYAHLKRAIHSN